MGKGTKLDTGKTMWHLMPWKCLKFVAEVITLGAKKYGENDWQNFVQRDNNEKRYFSACHRHLVEWESGDMYDKEWNKPHLAHAMCCILFILWNDIKKGRIK